MKREAAISLCGEAREGEYGEEATGSFEKKGKC